LTWLEIRSDLVAIEERAMVKVAAFVLAVWLLAGASLAASPLFSNPDLETKIEALFSPALELADVKFAVDEMVNADFSAAASKKQFDDLTSKLQAMIPAGATAYDKLLILRKFIYERDHGMIIARFNMTKQIRSAKI
jgi:hypothetical protein